jgi:hypothetical protein
MGMTVARTDLSRTSKYVTVCIFLVFSFSNDLLDKFFTCRQQDGITITTVTVYRHLQVTTATMTERDRNKKATNNGIIICGLRIRKMTMTTNYGSKPSRQCVIGNFFSFLFVNLQTLFLIRYDSI